MKALAEQGDANAQNQLGMMFSDGISRPSDYAQAKQWWEKAAAQNHVNAIYHLGLLY